MYLAPVGTESERATGKFWPGAWYDATGFGLKTVPGYISTYGHYHTGADLNLPSQGDIHKPVMPIGSGTVVFSGLLPTWGYVCVVRHAEGLWGRYAHLIGLTQPTGATVSATTVLGLIAKKGEGHNYSDHLHFDIAKIDLGAKPADWPGRDIARLLNSYYNPIEFLRDQLIGQNWVVTGPLGANVRYAASVSSSVYGHIKHGAVLKPVAIGGDFITVEVATTVNGNPFVGDKPLLGYIHRTMVTPQGS